MNALVSLVSRVRPLATVLAVATLGVALAGAGGLAAETSAASTSFRVNLVRWNALTENQKNALRANYRRWLERPAAQRAQVETRFATLRRLQDRLQLSDAADPTPDRLGVELTWQLEGLTRQLRRELPEAPTDISLTETVELLFRRRAEAFLEHLQARGRITADEHARLTALPAAALADESLQLLKADRLALLPPDRAAQWADADPRDVAARVDDLVRQDGFLGRAGREWPLTDDERGRLADLRTPAEVRDSVRQLRASVIRSRFQGHPLTAEQVDSLLAAPWNELQRSLEDLLAAG